MVPKILEFYGDFQYKSTAVLTENIIKTHKIYSPISNIATSEDFISYSKDGMKIQILEKTFKDIATDIGCLYINLEFPFDIDGDILIHTKNPIKGNWGRYGYMQKRRKLKKINKEHFNFNTLKEYEFIEAFDVFSNDVGEVLELVDKEFISKIMELNYVLGRYGLIFSIKENQVFLQLDTNRNLFEVGWDYNNPVANSASIKRFLEELHFVKEVIGDVKVLIECYVGNIEKFQNTKMLAT